MSLFILLISSCIQGISSVMTGSPYVHIYSSMFDVGCSMFNMDAFVKTRHSVEKPGQGFHKCLWRLDSGLRRNDGKRAFL